MNELIEKLKKLECNLKKAASMQQTIESYKNEKSANESQNYLNFRLEKTEIINRNVLYQNVIPTIPMEIKELASGKNIDDILLKNNNYESNRDEFIKQCLAFDKKVLGNIAQYKKEKEISINNEKLKSDEINNKYDDLILEMQRELNETVVEIENCNLLNEKYFNLIGLIIEILEDGRSNNLTDALNLAISEKRDIDYKNMQLELQERELEEIERQTELAEIKEERERKREEFWNNNF